MVAFGLCLFVNWNWMGTWHNGIDQVPVSSCCLNACAREQRHWWVYTWDNAVNMFAPFRDSERLCQNSNNPLIIIYASTSTKQASMWRRNHTHTHTDRQNADVCKSVNMRGRRNCWFCFFSRKVRVWKGERSGVHVWMHVNNVNAKLTCWRLICGRS
jgi:hypothetical protein